MIMKTNITACVAALFLGSAGMTASAEEWQTKPDESWVNITGVVEWSDEGRFMLDYGQGLITIEMDDWDSFDEASFIHPGEKVTVSGRIDDNFYGARTIEAESVWAHNRNTFFYSSSADEEGDAVSVMGFPFAYSNPGQAPIGSWANVNGKVTEIRDREFTLDTGNYEIEVDTSTLDYNPLDEFGYQQIKLGHRVSVAGLLDDSVITDREIKASTIISLTKDSKTVTQ